MVTADLAADLDYIIIITLTVFATKEKI